MDSLIVYIHIVCGMLFGVTLIIMQLVTGPAMGKIKPGEDKEQAVAIIQGRAHITMDIVIVIQSITVIYLLITRWDMIGANLTLHIKSTLGITALVLANLLHFYWRGKKRRLKAEGAMEQFQALSRRTMNIERVVLVCAALTILLAVGFNHL